MAQLTSMPFAFTPVQIVDVTLGVGFGRANDRADVMLVQALLNKIMSAPGGAGSLPDFGKRPTVNPAGQQVFPSLAPLVVDGFFGNKTFAALKVYQTVTIAGRTALLADGAADPVHAQVEQMGGDPIGGRNQLILSKIGRMAMFKLNADILSLFGRVIQDAELPSLVLTSIRRHRTS